MIFPVVSATGSRVAQMDRAVSHEGTQMQVQFLPRPPILPSKPKTNAVVMLSTPPQHNRKPKLSVESSTIHYHCTQRLLESQEKCVHVPFVRGNSTNTGFLKRRWWCNSVMVLHYPFSLETLSVADNILLCLTAQAKTSIRLM